MDSFFEKELEDLLNRHGIDSDCSTPDHMLAKYIIVFLDVLKKLTKKEKESVFHISESETTSHT